MRVNIHNYSNIRGLILIKGKIFFIKKTINTFIEQGPIKLIKSDTKDIYSVTKNI